MSLQRPLTTPKRGPLSGIQVHPGDIQASTSAGLSTRVLERVTLRDLTTGLYHWATCLFIVALVCSQLLGAVWNSQTSTRHLLYGRSPTLGPSQIVGTNDVPYPDRVVACVRSGKSYEPKLVSSLLAAPGVSAILEDTAGTALHGYRLRQRRVASVTDSLDSATQVAYEASCRLIANTIDNIFDACLALGYTNLTRDSLRVVDDWDSNSLYMLPDTLPILIMPYSDNSPQARHAIPTWEGDACMFRLQDAYAASGSLSKMASFRAVNRSVRFDRTAEWLRRPGGRWKNGWYEDLEGMRWYGDLTSSAPGAPYFMTFRLFDMRTGTERDCSNPSDCEAAGKIGRWGNKFITSSKSHNFNSAYIANGTEFGLFIYESNEITTVRTVFDWETLLSNLSVALVLVRWIMGLVSLHSGALRGKSQWFSGGIGCVSGAGSFMLLPIASLPRLKMTLAAFWTVGCRFEGQQSALSDAWFVIYPAIAHFVLIYFSLLNMLAKALRRRISDVLFTPTVAALCLLHFLRLEIAGSGWLSGIDGRIPTVVFSDEVDKMQLADYFTTGIAWRMNGRVSLIFSVKVAILLVNLLPLLLTHSFPITKRCTNLGLHGVEKALALRARHVGGLGQSLTYIVAEVDRKKRRVSSQCLVAAVSTLGGQSSFDDSRQVDSGSNENFTKVTPIVPLVQVGVPKKHTEEVSRGIALVNSYELIRLGYLVFGDKYLITFDEWDLLSSMAPFKSFCHFWNHRVLVWKLRPVTTDADAEIAGGRALQWTQPQMWRLDDPRLQEVRWWQVSACSIQC